MYTQPFVMETELNRAKVVVRTEPENFGLLFGVICAQPPQDWRYPCIAVVAPCSCPCSLNDGWSGFQIMHKYHYFSAIASNVSG